jgi:2'-5' RNA ligase
MARVFSAVDITDEELLDELVRAQDQLDLGFNPVDREHIHITLEFFEDIQESEIEELKESMKDVDVESFSAEVKGLGSFPSLDYIRVVWAGFEDGMFHALRHQVGLHGVDHSNDHEFTPHATLVRVKDLSKKKKQKLQKIIREYEDHRFGEIEVNSVKLFKSELGPHGPRYTKLFEKQLE